MTKKYLLQMTDAEDLAWRAAAARQGLTFAGYIRLCLTTQGARPLPVHQPPVARVEGSVSAGRAEPQVAKGRVATVDSSEFRRVREEAREMALRDGKCTADVSKGMRCKLCGKIH